MFDVVGSDTTVSIFSSPNIPLSADRNLDLATFRNSLMAQQLLVVFKMEGRSNTSGERCGVVWVKLAAADCV